MKPSISSLILATLWWIVVVVLSNVSSSTKVIICSYFAVSLFSISAIISFFLERKENK